MPELPEVEIVKKSLNQKIRSKKILKAIVNNRNLRFKIPANFNIFLENKIIKKISRFSKYIILHFSNETFCIIHLGMSGTIHLVDDKKKNKYTNTSFYNTPNLPKKHNHVEIQFQGLKMVYNDPRRFGFFRLIENRTELIKRFSHLGPEPFSKLFNTSYLLNYLRYKKKSIKVFLLDQNFVSGLGNIYASEILFFCKINPNKRGMNLNATECKKLIYFSRRVLNKAIEKGGSSIKNFKDTTGKMGLFQKEFKVYQRENLNCLRPRCSGKIKKKNIANRSTFFCNICQK